MAGGVFQDWVTDSNTGAVIPGATVTVRDEASGALSTIWSDAALSVPLANPITADLDGFVRFYTEAGLYRIEAINGLTSATLRNVPIGDAQARDAGVATADGLPDRDDADARYLNQSSNLSDLINTATARTNLGLGTMATEDAADYPSTSDLGTAAFVDIASGPGNVPSNAALDARLGTTGNLGTMAQQDADNVDITGGTAVLDSIYIEGDSYFGGNLGSTILDCSLYVPNVTNAVNHVTIRGAVTGSGVSVAAEGSDTNIDVNVASKGTGVINLSTNGNTRARVTGAGRLLIGSTLPTDDTVNNVQISGSTVQALRVGGRLTVQNGAVDGFVFGADVGAVTLTNSTTKFGVMTGKHYDTSEENVCLLIVQSTSTSSDVLYGGGNSGANAVTNLRFFTAANTTTTTGTERLRINSSGQVLAFAATGGIGYATGAGGAVTQATSKSTGVTLNNVTGQITMNNAVLATATAVGFTLTNSAIGANDTVIVNIKSGATADTYSVTVDAVAAGSCRISVRNNSLASPGEAIVLQFNVIKGAIS